jgi:hypothetical protein
MTITDLDQDRWDYLQRNVRAEYEIPDGATRLCLTFSREGEERHAEMPLGVIIGLLVGLGMTGTFTAFTKALNQLNRTTGEADPGQSEPYDPDFADRLENGAYEK